MGNKYEIKVTRQALEQMREIAHYISYDLMAPEAADNLLDDLKASILNYWIDEEYNKVQVTAVIYSKRDQIKQLKNMEMN